MTDSRSPSLIVELRLPAYQFVLSRTLAAVPEMIVELERFVPTGPSSMPYLWATGDGRRGFEDAVETDPDVERVTPVDAFDGGGLFRVAWTDVDSNLFEWLRAGESGALQAIGQEDEWFLKLRFEDRGSIGEFQEYCQDHDVDFTLHRLYETRAPKLGQYDLTVAQRKAIVTALEMGYFAVPREAKLEEVAAELDLSTNAVSERLRRGEANLFRSALTIDRPPRRELPDQ